MASTILAGPGLGSSSLVSPVSGTPAINTAMTTVDATGEKLAFVGPVWFPGRSGTKDIRRVWFRFGTIVKAGGSGLTVSLQNIASGAIMQPDGTPDETVAIANGDAGFASNTIYRTGTLSADRTVSWGDPLAVVIEFDGSGRLGSDSFILTRSSFDHPFNNASGWQFHNATSWGTINPNCPAVLLEMSDGSYGTLLGGVLGSNINTHSYDDGTDPDEHAMPFEVDVPCSLEFVTFYCNIGFANASMDVKLYNGTTLLTSTSYSRTKNGAAIGSNQRTAVPLYYGTLSPGTQYYLGFKATHATDNIQIGSIDVYDAAHLAVLQGGTGWTYTTRNNSGSWAAATTTRRLLCSPWFGAFDDGAGGSGGVIGGPNKRGGMQ